VKTENRGGVAQEKETRKQQVLLSLVSTILVTGWLKFDETKLQTLA